MNASEQHVATAASIEDRRRSSLLFRAGAWALAAGVIYFLARDGFELHAPVLLGCAMLALSIWPSLLWARRAQFGLPLFAAFMLTGLTSYALPLLTGHEALARFDRAVIVSAATGVILFQLAAILAFAAWRVTPGRRAFWRREIVTQNLSRVLGYGMLLTTLYTVIAATTAWIPARLESVVRAVAYGIGIIATFIQARRWGEGSLTPAEKFTFAVMLTVQVLFSWLSLLLVGGISIIVLGLLGYISGGKKIPVVLVLLLIPLLSILHNGKSSMRHKYWDEEKPAPSLAQAPAFFSEWVAAGLSPQPDEVRPESNRLLERSSLFHLMCLVVSITPDRQPYLWGETYRDVPGQLVPRFLWPDKPLAHVSTYRLAVYYGLQTEEDTRGTTIGFGLLTEAYSNFGYAGLAVLGICFGALARIVETKAAGNSLLTYGGLLTVVLMAWSFQTEFTLSIWLGSLLQAVVAVLGISMFVRTFSAE